MNRKLLIICMLVLGIFIVKIAVSLDFDIKDETITALIIDKLTAEQGEIVEMSAMLLLSNSSPAVNEKINFYLGSNKMGEEYTGPNGKAVLQYDTTGTSPGTHTIKAEYEGDETKEGSSDSRQLEITPGPVSGTVSDPEPVSQSQPDIQSSLPDIKCDYETIQAEEYYIDTIVTEECGERSIVDNESNNISIGNVCVNITNRFNNIRKVDRQVCKKDSRRIELDGQVFEFEKLHQNCRVLLDRIECDETCYELNGKPECGDGDGDGICESGETCFIYSFDSGLELDKVNNGVIDITHMHSHKSFIGVVS